MKQGGALSYLDYACNLAGLEPQMKSALLLHIEGLGSGAIATMLNITKGAAAVALSEARRLLEEYPWNPHEQVELSLALMGGDEEPVGYDALLLVYANRFGGTGRTPVYDSENSERANDAMRPANVVNRGDLHGVRWREVTPRTTAEVLAYLNEQTRGAFGPSRATDPI